ncbi:MAG: hypothetical protein WKF37_05100 [Bryobacteraceae bacterium]
MQLGVRHPSPDEVQTARRLLAAAPGPGPYRELPLVFARETVIISETYPKTERVPVQVLRIRDVGFAAFAGEPFVELGLEVRKCGLRQQFLIGLSNEHVGYVPTVEAHEQGGHETWRAKTSYLEKLAAPKVTAATLRHLDSLAS